MFDMEKLSQITTLAAGAHDPDSGQMCVMEAAAYIAGEPWSDHPQCVSPVIATFLRSWNDQLPDADRTRLLLPLLPMVIGTRTTDFDEETRAWMATDWLVRVQTPAWMDHTPSLASHAAALRALPPLTSSEIAVASQPVMAAARAAASAAASAAALDAKRAGSSVAARDAASAAASAAALDVASVAALDVASVAAWDAAWAAALAAARDAKMADLAPTVAALQASAVELVTAMCAVGRDAGGTDA